MHLLNIIQCTNLGGMEQANLLLLKGLKARGHAVELFSLNPLGALRPHLDAADIPARGIAYRGRGGWRSFPAMVKNLRRDSYDAILLNGHNFLASAAIAAVPAKRKVMSIHFHHFEPGTPARRWSWIYGLAENVFDAVTFCSDFIRREALAVRPSLGRKSVTVPYPFIVPTAPSWQDRATARAALGVGDTASIVGNAGWLIKRKRFDVFLDVAAEVLRVAPATKFVIAGDGPERTALEARARRLGIDSNVVFLGWQSDIANFYKAIDLLLFNSDFDALGRTPGEAAVFGVPVVASVAQGGLKEMFRGPDEAIVLDSHDVQCLTQAVLYFLMHEGRRRKLGDAGRERVEDYGSLTKHVDKFERLLF